MSIVGVRSIVADVDAAIAFLTNLLAFQPDTRPL